MVHIPPNYLIVSFPIIYFTVSGKLKLKRRKPKKHGPAYTISLLWERTTTEKHTTMEISVDLCSALKIDFENYSLLLHQIHLHRLPHIVPSSNLNHARSTDSVLPLSDSVTSNYVDYVEDIKSVLLMPRDGMRFKVAFTESELLLTSNLSDHHRKCYRLLKYIVNGEPFPLKGSKIRRFFKDTHTFFHSYIIKLVVWEHHYFKKCGQEINLGICITEMLPKLKAARTEVLMHPFNRNRIIETSSEWKEKLPPLSAFRADLLGLDILLPLAIMKIKNTPIDAYDYKSNLNAVLSSQGLHTKVRIMRSVFYSVHLALLMIIVLLHLASGAWLLSLPLILFSVVFLFAAYAYGTMPYKCRKWAISLSLCTEHFNLWVTCMYTGIILVFIIIQPDLLLVIIYVMASIVCLWRYFAGSIWDLIFYKMQI